MRRRPSLVVIFAAVALVVLLSTAVVYLMGLRVTRANETLFQRRRVIEQLERTLSDLRDAETGQRGFLLTGEESYLEPYNAAQGNISRDLQELGEQAAAGRIPSEQVQTVTRLARQKLSELALTIDLRRTRGGEAAIAAVRSEGDERIMGELRRDVAEMVRQQEAEFSVLWGRRVTANLMRTLVTAVMAVLTCAFLVWMFRRIHREMENTRRQRELLSVTLASIGDAVIVTNAQGRIRFLNKEAERLTGWPQRDAAGQDLPTVFRIVNAQTRQVVESPGDKVMRLGCVDGLAKDTILVARDGTETPIDDSGAPIRGADGTVHGVVLIFRDFTVARRAEDSLRHAQATAEAASKAKDHFLAVLSHELRNPLSPVLAAAASLREDPRFDADTREQLEIIHRNAELEARLIDDLLDVTRIERGKVELDRQPSELGTIIRRAAEVCMPEIKASRLQFSMDLGPSDAFWVDADAARLQQVFWNLIKNAVKFTPVGGRVLVRCQHDLNGSVITEVCDTGDGIAPEVLGRIFNAFEQAERSITRQFGGLGLGLAISRGLVEMHGGSIHAQSHGKGHGATFTVCLPLLPADAVASATRMTPEVRSAVAPVRPLCILLVEDHGDTAKIMKRLLSAAGHDVRTAADVATALELALAQPFDLLLSDLGLPDGSGLDLIRAIRSNGIHLPAIALSGFGQETDIQQCRDAGFKIHLTKPVSLARLQQAIASAAEETADAN